MSRLEHVCHARDCKDPCPPKHLMCKRHWSMVPKALQSAVWDTYSPGQERGVGLPTRDWHDAADAAIRAVADKEAKASRTTKRETPKGPSPIEKRFGKR